MRNYPEKIEKLQFDIADLNVSIERERERIDDLEADLTVEIHTMRGDDGKPVFTNEALRKAAFLKLCGENADLVAFTQSLQTLETTRLRCAATLERLRLEYKLFLLDREAEITK